MITYNPNDIFIARRNGNSSSFSEYVLKSVPNTIITFDSASNLVAVPTQSYNLNTWETILNTWNTYNMNWDGSPITSSYALSASYAPAVNAITASYSSHALSSSYAPFSQSYQVSSSYATITSFAISSSYAPFSQSYQISASWANVSLTSSYAIQSLSASYIPNNFPNSLSAGQTYYTIIGDDANSSNITWYNTQGGLVKGRLNQRSNQELVWSANVNDLDQLDDTSLGAMKMSIYVPGNTFTIQTAGPQSSWSDGHNTPLEINLSTGNVGINQETPQFTLDVGGYIGNSQYNLSNYISLDDGSGNIKISAANDLSFSINRNVSYNNNSIYGINRMYDTLGDYLDNYFNYNFVQGTQWQIQDSGQSSPLFYVQSKNNGSNGAVGTMNTVFDDGTGSMVIGNALTVNNSSLFKLGLKTTAGDTFGPGVVEAQFGSTIPFYMMSDFPALGFNAYYSGGFVYGAGSSNSYAAFQAFDPTSGAMIYYFSENAGNAGDIWPSNNIVLKFNKDGQVSIPSLSTPGYLTNDGNGTIETVSSIYSDIFDVNGSVGIAYGEPKYRLDIYGGVGNSQGDFPIQSNLGNNYNTIINNGGGNVGIGTGTPQNNLDVYGNVSFITNSITINNSDPFYINSNPTIVISSSNNTLGIQGALIIGSDGNAQHWSRINNDGTSDFAGSLIHFTNHGDGVFTSLTSSNGFLGTASYAFKSISASYAPSLPSISSSYALSASYPHYSLITDTGTYVGINQTNPTYLLDVHGTLGNSYGNLFLQANGANVGIGTLSAQFLLDVKGTIGNSAGDLSLNSSTNIQLSSSGQGVGMTGSLGVTGNISSSGAISTGGKVTSTGYILTGSYTSIVTGSYTLRSADNGQLLQINSGSLSYITVPSGLPQGFNCSLLQRGTAQFILNGSGTSVYNAYNNSASYGQWAVVSLLQLDSGSYLLQGATA